MRKITVLITLLLFFPLLSFAAIWKIVPDKSSITFTAMQNDSPVKGEFKTFSGDINFDSNALPQSHVLITIDMNSVTTSYKEVENTLKTANWFDSKLFPTATFAADQFKKTGEKTYIAEGKLTLRNKTMPIVLNFTLEKFTNNEAIVSGSADLKRTAFEIGQGEWKSTKEIKDDVVINFKIEANKK